MFAAHSNSQRSTEVSLLLEDGSKVVLVGSEVGFVANRGALGSIASADFRITQEVVEALASSGPTLILWSWGDDVVDQQIGGSQRERHYRRVFSCLLQQL